MRLTLAQRAHLVTLYSEPHRHYHTTEHIYHCLRELESIPNLSESDKSVLELAIWFHDSVYDPKAAKGHNEMASSDLLYSSFSGVANSASSEGSLSLVEELITATINHEIPDREAPETERLLSYFLDIDLSILGQPQDTYDRYAEQIRKEYSFVEHEAYASGRRRILLSFAGRDKIYLSKHFQDKYELEARKNISRELLRLAPTKEIVIHEKWEYQKPMVHQETPYSWRSLAATAQESYLREQVVNCLRGKIGLSNLFAYCNMVVSHLPSSEKDIVNESTRSLATQLVEIGNDWEYGDLENSKTLDKVRALLEGTENKESTK